MSSRGPRSRRKRARGPARRAIRRRIGLLARFPRRRPGLCDPHAARAIKKSGDYFSLIGKYSNPPNYYHWIHDALLRLHGAEDHLPSEVKYLVPPLSQAFKRETLHMLGLHDEQLVTFTGEEVWQCERLWFASLPPSGAEVPEAVSWLRERIFSATATRPSSSARRRLYISRKGAVHGRVVNEDELVSVLESKGFEIIEPEQMSVAEQVQMFSQAEYIVAPHGAGQTNMVFAGPSCKNLELLEPKWASDRTGASAFWTLAETIGQPFAYVVCDSVSSSRGWRADLYVSPAVLENALASVLDGTSYID